MKTIIKTGMWKILEVFYKNKNKPLHLREIARKAGMNESGASRYLNFLEKNKILLSKSEGNLRMFYVSKKRLPEFFPIFDNERFSNMPFLRRNAVKLYLKDLNKKPLILVVFGSTAKKTYKNKSDIDLLEIVNSKQDNKKARDYAEAQTGIDIQVFQVNLGKFKQDLKIKKDKVLESAIETGFPVFNAKYYYEVLNE